ncbi:MAG: hypothetical protein K8T25_07115 [Planctomycetia bacterium]|nr:hypothetical protein [Planctomycetia bacterium]
MGNYALANLPRQAGYVYRIWVRGAVGITGRAYWYGSTSTTYVDCVAQSVPDTIVDPERGVDPWKFFGVMIQPADSNALRVQCSYCDAVLVECLGRCYSLRGKGEPAQYQATGVDVDGCGAKRQTAVDSATITCQFAVIPGVTYRILARVLERDGCSGVCISESFGFAPRAPGSGDPNQTDHDQGNFSAPVDNFHQEPGDSCGGFVGYGTVSYWLSNNSASNPASVAPDFSGPPERAGGNHGYVQFAWKKGLEGCGESNGPLFILTDFYALPVGFTLRETTGGVSKDTVWQDAPTLSSDARLILEKLDAINTSVGGSSGPSGSYSSTDLGSTTGGTLGVSLPSQPYIPLDNNLPSSIGTQNYQRDSAISEPALGTPNIHYNFEFFPTSGGHISALGSGLVDLLLTYKQTMRDAIKVIISVGWTMLYFSRLVGA